MDTNKKAHSIEEIKKLPLGEILDLLKKQPEILDNMKGKDVFIREIMQRAIIEPSMRDDNYGSIRVRSKLLEIVESENRGKNISNDSLSKRMASAIKLGYVSILWILASFILPALIVVGIILSIYVMVGLVIIVG